MLVFSQNNTEYFTIINIKYYLLNHTYSLIRRYARTHTHTHKNIWLPVFALYVEYYIMVFMHHGYIYIFFW